MTWCQTCSDRKELFGFTKGRILHFFVNNKGDIIIYRWWTSNWGEDNC